MTSRYFGWTCAFLLGTASATRLWQSPTAPQAPAAAPVAGPDMNASYRIGPDSLPQEGVPKGEIRGPFTLPSQAYPGTQHTYWVYVPAQYDPAVPGEPDGLPGRPGVQGHERRSCARRT